MHDVLVVGAGPAGLMAALALTKSGLKPIIAEAKPSIARKFLMAGKSGLNIANAQDPKAALTAYHNGEWAAVYSDHFSAQEVVDWAQNYEQPLFLGSSGRYFPKAMKASGLLRSWARDLGQNGAELLTKWRLCDWDGAHQWQFETPLGRKDICAKYTVLAMGGKSWSRLGSDGLWAEILGQYTDLADFAPSNVGLQKTWSPYMTPHFGRPIKNLLLVCGTLSSRGEIVVSEKGLEGGGLYPLSPMLRESEPLFVNFLPEIDRALITNRIDKARRKGQSLPNILRKTLHLSHAACALLYEEGLKSRRSLQAIVDHIQSCPINHAGLRPLDEAISTIGGIKVPMLNADLSVKSHPHVFCAGEMIDWEAPTGGFLIHLAMAQGKATGEAIASALAQGR